MKRNVLLLLTLVPMITSAFTGEAIVDGIKYYIITKGKTAEVRPNQYNGDIVIPDIIEYEGVICNVTSIGNQAFSNCKQLSSIIIGNNVTSIGEHAFSGCSGITTLDIPNNVTTIGKKAFSWCDNLESVTIGDGVVSIGSYAFELCRSIYSISIPNSVTSIGEYAFSNCSGLKFLSIPNNMTYIDDYVFFACSSLTELTIPNGVSTIGKAAFRLCSSLTSLDIPNTITTIGEEAFSECSSLTSISIPNSVTNIGFQAFNNCRGMKTLVIGNGVKKIEYGAFSECSELTDVYCYAEDVPSTHQYSFYSSYIEYATLHIPASSIDLYKNAIPWKDFGTIIATETIENLKCSIPAISYSEGKLTFNCETDGAICHSTIENSDIGEYDSNEIQLTATYHISVYATKDGFDDSDIATATLCWIDSEPKTEGMSNNIVEARGFALLIQSHDGMLNVTGAKEGTCITVYSVSGVIVGSTIARGSYSSVLTSLHGGDVAIVRVGDKSVKVVME